YRITRKDCQLFAFAAIWEEHTRNGNFETRFAIITTAANELMQPIHTRMPVILPAGQEEAWLGKKARLRELLSMFEPAPSGDLKAYEISRLVNRAEVDTFDVIQPVA